MLEMLSSTFGLAASLLAAIVLTFAVVREGRKGYVASATTVIRDFKVSPDPITGVNVHVVGRRKGLIAWLLTLLGIENRVELTVTDRDWSLRSSSPTGFSNTYIPLKNVATTLCGYQRSVAALFFFVYFGLNAFLALLTILASLLRIATEQAEAMREVAAQTLEKELEALLAVLILAAIAFLFFYFSKRVKFGVQTGGTVHGLLFKRSVVENKIIDIANALQATLLLNRLHEAAVYGTVPSQIPSCPTEPPKDKQSHGWLTLAAVGTYVSLILLTVLVHIYGSGVTLQVSPSPVGAAVLVDDQFKGASTDKEPVVTIEHVSRDKHEIAVLMDGYAPFKNTFIVGGMRATQKVPVRLSPMKYSFQVLTTPSGARISIDGRDVGVTDGRGQLKVQVEHGEHQLAAALDGYRTESRNVNVSFDRQYFQFFLANAEQAARQEAETRQQEISGHLERAQSLFRQGQYQPALEECDQVLKLDPSNSSASSLKSQIEQTKKILGQ